MASLRNDLAQDQAGATRGRIEMRDRMVKQVSLITHGLVEQSNRVTVYKSELWRSFGGSGGSTGATESRRWRDPENAILP